MAKSSKASVHQLQTGKLPQTDERPTTTARDALWARAFSDQEDQLNTMKSMADIAVQLTHEVIDQGGNEEMAYFATAHLHTMLLKFKSDWEAACTAGLGEIPDGTLLSLCSKWRDAHGRAIAASDQQADAEWNRVALLTDSVVKFPATTPEGLRAKAELALLLWEKGDISEQPADAMLLAESILKDAKELGSLTG